MRATISRMFSNVAQALKLKTGIRDKRGRNMGTMKRAGLCVVVVLAVPALAAFLVLVPGARAAKAAAQVFVVTFSGEFGTVNLSNGVFRQIGANVPESLGNLVWANGTLYSLATGGSNVGDLVKINPSTGQVTDVGPTGLGPDAFSLGGVGGNLYLTDFNVGGGVQNLYSVNPATGAATLIGPTGVPADLVAPFTIINNSWIVLCDETITGVGGELYVTFDEVSFDLKRQDSTYLNEKALIPAALYEVDSSGATTEIGPTIWNDDGAAEVGGSTYLFSVGIKAWTNKSGPLSATQVQTVDLGSGDATPVMSDGTAVYITEGEGVAGAAPVQP